MELKNKTCLPESYADIKKAVSRDWESLTRDLKGYDDLAERLVNRKWFRDMVGSDISVRSVDEALFSLEEIGFFRVPNKLWKDFRGKIKLNLERMVSQGMKLEDELMDIRRREYLLKEQKKMMAERIS